MEEVLEDKGRGGKRDAVQGIVAGQWFTSTVPFSEASVHACSTFSAAGRFGFTSSTDKSLDCPPFLTLTHNLACD